jgi:hypothetical protein
MEKVKSVVKENIHQGAGDQWIDAAPNLILGSVSIHEVLSAVV